MVLKTKNAGKTDSLGNTVVVIPCPTYPARPEGEYLVYSFLTPENKEVIAMARKLMEENGWSDDPLMVFSNFVNVYIEYVSDRKQHGIPEYWSFAFETLKRLKGDCEDVSWLLGSLLLATQYLDELQGSGLNIYADDMVRVPLGAFKGHGHAWVDVYTDLFSGEWEWYTVEPTADDELSSGYNAWRVEYAISMGYEPELYVYREICERIVGNAGIYKRRGQTRLVYGFRGGGGLCSILRKALLFILDAIS